MATGKHTFFPCEKVNMELELFNKDVFVPARHRALCPPQP